MVALAAFLLVRLVRGGLEAPHVRVRLPVEVLPPALEVGDFQLVYESASISLSKEGIALHLTGIRADTGTHRLEAAAAEAVVAPKALAGDTAPIRRLEVDGARITTSLPPAEAPLRPTSRLDQVTRAANVVADLLPEIDLERLEMTSAEIHVLDPDGEVWSTREADLSVWRDREAQRAYARPGSLAPNTTLFYERRFGAPGAKLEADLDGVPIEGLPVSGRITFHLDEVAPACAEVALTLDAGGYLDIPAVGDSELDVEQASVHASITEDVVEVLGFDVTIDGARATGAGTWPLRTAGFEADASLDGATLAQVEAHWPKDLAPEALDWLKAHVRRGTASNVRLIANLQAPPSLTFDFSDVAVKLPDIPLITRARGRAQITPHRLDLFAGRAFVGGLSTRRGRLRFFGLGAAPGRLELETDLLGPTAAAVALAGETCPDGRLAGEADLHLELSLPFDPEVRTDRMTVAVTGRATNLALEGAKVLDRFAVENGDVEVTADRRTIRLKGTASIEGVPMLVSWRRNLETDTGRVRLQATLDERARDRLGVPRLSGLLGPVVLDLDASTSDHGSTRARATIDLTPASIDVPMLGFEKPSWAPAEATVFAKVGEDGSLDVERTRIRGDDLDVIGSFRIDPTGTITSADLTRVRLAGHDFSVRVQRRPDLLLTVRGRSFDARPLLDRIDDKGDAEGGRTTVDLRLHHVRVTDNVTVKAVSGLIHLDPVGLREARLAARAGRARLLLSARRQGGGHQVDLKTSDAGALAKELGVASSILGGRGRILGSVGTIGGRPVLEGRAIIRDYRVAKTPGLAALASTSFEGIIDLIRGKGVHFDETDVRFSLDGRTLHIDEAQASGAALALATHGSIDLVRGRTNLEARVAPLNDLNRMIRQIPVIGKLLVPKGDGLLIAPSYSVHGDLARPKVRVKAESLILPAFLRRLFSR